MIQISKTGCKNLRMLKISRSKFLIREPLHKTWVLTISLKYLHLYGMNRGIKESIDKKDMPFNYRQM